MKKILYISGTRADYGLIKEVLFAVKKHSRLKIEIAATGMHLMPEFGNTVKEIEKELEGKLTESEISEAIDKLCSSGDIFKPRRGFIQKM